MLSPKVSSSSLVSGRPPQKSFLIWAQYSLGVIPSLVAVSCKRVGHSPKGLPCNASKVAIIHCTWIVNGAWVTHPVPTDGLSPASSGSNNGYLKIDLAGRAEANEM
eukprot:6458311-Amphidinium_carterae.1